MDAADCLLYEKEISDAKRRKRRRAEALCLALDVFSFLFDFFL